MQSLGESRHRNGFLAAESPREHHALVGEITRTELEPERRATRFPLVILGTRLHVAQVGSGANARSAQLLHHLVRAAAYVRSRSSSLFQIGTITTCHCASRGGQTSPLSSLCVMINPPTIRVDTPHEVLQT